jgi:hypothetical protein
MTLLNGKARQWAAAMLTAFTIVSTASPARAHFLWILVEPEESAKSPLVHKAHVFLSETPAPESEKMLKFVEGVVLNTPHGAEVPLKNGADSREATWLGDLPATLDAERDMGVMTRGDKTFRLAYTARSQSKALKAADTEKLKGLRVRLIEQEGGSPALQVVNDGKPVDGARIRVYPEKGDHFEAKTDKNGIVELTDEAHKASLKSGNLAVFANHVDPTAGKAGDKDYAETRHYATWTFAAPSAPTESASVPSAIGQMPAPAVNSFGGAVLGDWLYVYSGHVGTTHKYDTETTTKTFRRFNLKDRTTWENLPIERDLQGVALVTDGKYLYRTGGMFASNPRGEKTVIHSVADCERFDPETKTWTKLPSLPSPRSTHDSFVIGRKLFVAGGWDLSGSTDESDFHADLAYLNLDDAEKGWKTVEQPFERRALSVAEAGGKLYVLGGLTSDSGVSRTVDVFDPATDQWSKGPELPAGSKAEGFGTSAYTIAGRLFYNGVTGPIYRLSKDGGRWEAVGQWHVPRITHRILPGLAGDLLAVGGNVGRDQTPVIESLPVNLLPE